MPGDYRGPVFFSETQARRAILHEVIRALWRACEFLFA
jgi:hypothetical protein